MRSLSSWQILTEDNGENYNHQALSAPVNQRVSFRECVALPLHCWPSCMHREQPILIVRSIWSQHTELTPDVTVYAGRAQLLARDPAWSFVGGSLETYCPFAQS